jgi:lipopolysaccharide/colanic/teichoic acid biosynthesis glycosyltransferase
VEGKAPARLSLPASRDPSPLKILIIDWGICVEGQIKQLKTQSLRYVILAADLVWAAAAMGLACLLPGGSGARSASPDSILVCVPALLLALFLWIVLSSWLRLDGFRGGWRGPAVLSELFPAVAGLMATLFAGGFLLPVYASRLALSYFGLLLFLGFVLIRFTLRWILGSWYRVGTVRRIVIVGDGALAQEMAAAIDRHPELLCQIVGFLCPAGDASDLSSDGAGADQISLQTVGIVDLLQSRRVDEIILTVPEPGHSEILDLAATCRAAGVAVSLVPQPYQLYLSKPELVDLDGLPLLQWEGAGVRTNPHWKRVFDCALTACLLPVAAAAIVPAALLLKLRKGKGFQREVRCGQYGKTFWMYRLNSDRHAKGLPAHEFFMQRSSLTELPQLLNVLRGDMSLVGPRPEGPERTRHYSDWNQERLSVKPGMTGLAQVHGLREESSSEDKTKYDLQYILHRSSFQDISILLQTVWTITLRLLPWPRWRARTSHVVKRSDSIFKEALSGAHSPQSGSD